MKITLSYWRCETGHWHYIGKELEASLDGNKLIVTLPPGTDRETVTLLSMTKSDQLEIVIK